MSTEKRIVGSFNSDDEVLYAIEGLKRQGHRETDMMVVAESTSAIPSHFLVRSHGRGRSTNEDLNRCYDEQLFIHVVCRNGRHTG